MKKTVYTYLMYDGINYKIGKSINPRHRSNQLRISNINIKLVGYGSFISEEELHKEYADYRISGEWFKLTDEQANEILYKITGLDISVAIGIQNNSILTSVKGKFYHSDKLLSIKIKHFKMIDYLLWENILINVRLGENPSTSSGLFLKYGDYSDLCGRSSYHKSKKKFLDLKLLLPTPNKKYFIINPYYVCKINNLKIEK